MLLGILRGRGCVVLFGLLDFSALFVPPLFKLLLGLDFLQVAFGMSFANDVFLGLLLGNDLRHGQAVR